MNVKLLREVEKRILAEPRRFDMMTFGDKLDKEAIEALGEEAPPCGTVACIAGHVDWMTHPRLFAASVAIDRFARDDSIAKRAAIELGLGFDPSQDTNAGRLFFDDEWPKKFQAAFSKAKTPLQRAKVAVKRIEHFIKTNGKE